MRKIEQEMMAALKQRKPFNKDNTFIVGDDSSGCPFDYSWVFLHGNNLGYWRHSDGQFEVNRDTLKQWPTVTTKSRLRALGVNLTQKKGKIYIDDVFICNA